MARGYLAFVLHAHLPFVRHPEDASVMEERWLYEAVADTYLPLLEVLEGLESDGVGYRVTVSLSASLMAMLDDDLLRDRCRRHLESLIALADREQARTESEEPLCALARMYGDRFRRLLALWDRHDGRLVDAFAALAAAGSLELLTSTATHAFFPLLDRNWPALRSQVRVAVNHFRRRLGGSGPAGMWLGECGYVPGADELLREAGVRFFFVEGHALELARPPAHFGVYAPVFCPSGVAAFGRDAETAAQVWSADGGYPGDPIYRDFYRDIGFDLDEEELGEALHPSGARLYTGIKYHAITHKQLHGKDLYDPEKARARVGLHAAHFRHRRQQQIERLADQLGRPPLIVAPYDAELFGHWWFEGPTFLGDVLRQLHFDQDVVETITLSEYLDRHPTQQLAVPSASSWGEGGYNSYWLNESNCWIYPHLHLAGERMVELTARFPESSGTERRALNQAARELLLAQSSDWPFILRTGTTVSYAKRRFEEHIRRFTRLYRELSQGEIAEDWLAEIESRDNLFPHLDYRVFRPE